MNSSAILASMICVRSSKLDGPPPPLLPLRSAQSRQAQVNRYVLDYATGLMPNFRYRPEADTLSMHLRLVAAVLDGLIRRHGLDSAQQRSVCHTRHIVHLAT